MRGHEALIALRKTGVRPQIVFIEAGIDHAETWRTWQDDTPEHAYVEVGPDDAISSLDLRFVVGMNVVISGPDERRVGAVYRLCQESGAKRVLGAFVTVCDEHGQPKATVHSVKDSAEAE